MWYISFIFLSVLFFKFRLGPTSIFENKRQPFWLASLPFIILWTFFIGGQDNVGADYPTYLYFFNGHISDVFANKEWIFHDFIVMCNKMGFYGQSIFIIIALVNCIFLISFCKKFISLRNMALFIFLFITIPGMFNNQMNGLRQYIAVYMMSMCYLVFTEKKYLLSIFLLYIAMCIHNTAIIAAILFVAIDIFVYLYESKWNNKIILYALIALSVVICLTFDAIPVIQQYLKYIPFYNDSYWIYQEFVSNETENKLRKLVNVPFYLYCVYILDKINFSLKERKLYIAGILGFCIKISFLGVTFINRMGQYFELIMCIPIFFAIVHMKQTKNIMRYIWIAFFFFYYFLKVVIFPVGEYSYSSVFF